MSCPSADRVLDYVAGRLAGDERAAIDAHVDGCGDCRALLVELARTDLDALGARPAVDPTTIGRYRVTARLGEGGMGTVYQAHDPQLDREVAIKLVHPELAARGGLDRLLREGRALARLAHPNVVAVHDAGTDGDRVYIAMELVAGSTLAAWLKEPRAWRDIARVFAGAGRGIAAAHEAGIVHRDVKPENVLLDRAGHPKVADFGLVGYSDPAGAEAASAPSSREVAPGRLTQPGAVLGTPMFMSPEQRRGDPVGPATDQYSLCAALANALGARRIPRWLARAIARGRAADPAARFASIDQLVAAIDPARHARTARWLAAGAAGVALAGGAMAYVATRGDDPATAACSAAAEARATLWTDTDRAAVAAAMRKTGVTYAEDTSPRVDAAIREYVGELAAAEAATCAQRPASDAAAATFELAIECLAERRTELARLVGRFHAASARDVREAVTLVHHLSPVDDCTNASTLAAELAANVDPWRAGPARREVSTELGAAFSARDAGDYRAAADHARRAVARARELGGVVLAKALIASGDVGTLVDGFAASEAANREAATVAEAAHADDVRAYAMANLMAALAREPGREREALALQPLVTAAIERAGKHAALMPVVQQAAGTAQLRIGRTDDAIASFTAALAAARAVLPKTDPRMPEYIYPVGVALGMVRRDAEAVRYHDEAFRVATAVWGANHPNAARFEVNLGTKHAALGDCTTGIRELEHARTLLRGVLPDDSPEHLQISQAIGACHYLQHDHAAALREYTARQTALAKAGRQTSAEMAGSWVDIGDVQLDRKDYDAAAASYRRSVAEYEAVLGTTDARLGFPLSRIGEAELAASRPARAIAPLERAAALYAAAKVPAIAAAGATFPLARALWSRPADRARARTLAIAARDAFAAGGPAYAGSLAEVTAWLNARL